ncbi:MAG: class I SAM-dependent methyltransferase [Bacteroidia bacterium]|nr:class I SAM-dependent methyltransferase [Bacteroidia bacterium]
MNVLKSCFILFLIPYLGLCQYAEYEWEDRDRWMPVDRIFKLVGIERGSMVADIGCHEGYLSIHLANRVGNSGKVYAVDVRSDRLDLLKGHIEDREISNVKVIQGDYDDPKLPKGKLDVVIIMDTYHEMTDYEKILEHVHKALKPGGKLLILEKLKKRARNGSRSEQVDAHTLAPKYVKREMKAAQFKIIEEVNDLGYWEEDSDKPMWLLVGQKPKDSKWVKGKI